MEVSSGCASNCTAIPDVISFGELVILISSPQYTATDFANPSSPYINQPGLQEAVYIHLAQKALYCQGYKQSAIII